MCLISSVGPADGSQMIQNPGCYGTILPPQVIRLEENMQQYWKDYWF